MLWVSLVWAFTFYLNPAHHTVQGLYIIRTKYWNASGSGFPPSLILALWNIGILHYKQAKLPKHLQHSVCMYCVWCFPLIITFFLINVIAFTLFGLVEVRSLSNNKSLLAHSHSFNEVQGQFCEAFDSEEKWYIIAKVIL